MITGFNKEKFENDVFGVGRYPDAWWQWRPGWQSWQDVRQYFGLYGTETREQDLEEGKMHEKLYESLSGKIGEARLKSYFAPVERKLTKEERELEDLATLLAGNVAEKSRIRTNFLGKGNKK